MSGNNRNMKIIVSGVDYTEKLLAELSVAAQAHNDDKLAIRIERERPVLGLRDCTTEFSYLDLHGQLLRDRNSVDPSDFNQIPSSSPVNTKGRVVSSIQKILWKLLRYQHDWMAFRSNAIMTQLTYQLEFERAARKQLELKVSDMEKTLDSILLSSTKEGAE